MHILKDSFRFLSRFLPYVTAEAGRLILIHLAAFECGLCYTAPYEYIAYCVMIVLCVWTLLDVQKDLDMDSRSHNGVIPAEQASNYVCGFCLTLLVTVLAAGILGYLYSEPVLHFFTEARDQVYAIFQ